jgi:glutaredoxin 3
MQQERNMSEVVLIFGKDTCPYTSAAREDYKNAGKPFEYINVVTNRSELKRMLEYSKGVREVPVIVENGNVTIGYAGGS